MPEPRKIVRGTILLYLRNCAIGVAIAFVCILSMFFWMAIGLALIWVGLPDWLSITVAACLILGCYGGAVYTYLLDS
jgi:hypothetical protein